MQNFTKNEIKNILDSLAMAKKLNAELFGIKTELCAIKLILAKHFGIRNI